MRNYLKLILCLYCLIVCKKDVQRVKIESDYLTPEKTIETYWNALSKRDYISALECFTGFSREKYNENEVFPVSSNIDSIVLDSILTVEYKNKKNAEIVYKIVIFKKGKSRFILTGDKLVLTRKGWKIEDVFIPNKKY